MKHFFFIIGFQKEKANHSYSEKSSNKASHVAQIYYYDSPICRDKRAITPNFAQSAKTSRRLTLIFHQVYLNFYVSIFIAICTSFKNIISEVSAI